MMHGKSMYKPVECCMSWQNDKGLYLGSSLVLYVMVWQSSITCAHMHIPIITQETSHCQTIL